jgi:hypothetical protein
MPFLDLDGHSRKRKDPNAYILRLRGELQRWLISIADFSMSESAIWLSLTIREGRQD